jgi:sugar phosphate isomerase/epimerase
MPLPSRREFLATSAAAGAAVAVGATRAFAADDPYGQFKVGAQSYSFRKFNLERALKEYQSLGLKYAEFFNTAQQIPLTSTPAQVAAALKLCKEYGVTPIAFGVEKFTKNTDTNRKTFEFGKALGIKYLSADPDPDSFDSLDKLCEEYKIAIGIHPHGPERVRGQLQFQRWYSTDVILPAVKDHHPLIGTCIDTGHILRCVELNKKIDPAEEIRKMGKRNFGLHLKDFDGRVEVIAGKGMLNIPEVLRALKEVKFEGYVNLEYELNENSPTADMAEGLKALRDAAAKVG